VTVEDSIAEWLNAQAQHSGLHQLAVFGANYLLVVPILIAAYLVVRSFLRRDNTAMASLVLAGVGTLLALVANMAATSIWMRVRPYNRLGDVHALVTRATESSFFSDHTIAVTGCAVGALLVSRRWGVAAAVCAALVGIARVAVGAHYPTDVLTAAAVTTILILVLQPMRPRLARLLGVALAKVGWERPGDTRIA
jgi:undecaprenyl-diphosphatase